MQHYVVKFVSDLRQVGDFLWVFQFPPSIKLTTKVVNPIKIYIYSEPFNINLLIAVMSVCVVYIPLLVVSLFLFFVFLFLYIHIVIILRHFIGLGYFSGYVINHINSHYFYTATLSKEHPSSVLEIKI